MIATIAPARKAWTEEALQSLPEDGFIHEVVDGELVMSPKNNFDHGNICAMLLTALRTFAHAHRKLIASGGDLDGEDLLPGFRFPIADLFKEWDWE